MAEGNQSTRITKFGPAVDLQYVLDKKLHSSPQLHKIGEALLDPTYVSTMGNNQAPAVGQSDEVARADHVHGLNFGHSLYYAGASTDSVATTTTRTLIPGCSFTIPPQTNPGICVVLCSLIWFSETGGYGFGVGEFQTNENGAGWVVNPNISWIVELTGVLQNGAFSSMFVVNAGSTYVVEMTAYKQIAGGSLRTRIQSNIIGILFNG